MRNVIKLMNRYSQLDHLSKKDYEEIIDKLIEINSGIPREIYSYSFAYHFNQEYLFQEFKQLTLENLRFSVRELRTEDILEIQYSDFCTVRTESDWINVPHLKSYYNLNFLNGTFENPILLVAHSNQFKVFDGNNRLRFFRSLYKYSPEKIKDNHTVYILDDREED